MTERHEEAAGRVYAIPFHDVWDAALRVGEELRGWRVEDRDPRAGTLELQTLDRLGYRPLPASIRLWLDEEGQTRLEVRIAEESRPRLLPSARSRIRRFLRSLDRALGVPPSP